MKGERRNRFTREGRNREEIGIKERLESIRLEKTQKGERKCIKMNCQGKREGKEGKLNIWVEK